MLIDYLMEIKVSQFYDSSSVDQSM